MARPARVSPARILAAAADEFAERGFGGARVDRIARRARVNKAMLYYHFKSKRDLYRALLRRVFTLASERMGAIARSNLSSVEKIERAVAGFADLIREHPYMPAIMLREVAEAGVHLDRDTLAALSGVPRTVAGIIQEGAERRAFRPVDPVFAYFSMMAPIVMFLAAAPIRQEVQDLHLMNLGAGSSDQFVHHMQDMLCRALACDASRA